MAGVRAQRCPERQSPLRSGPLDAAPSSDDDGESDDDEVLLTGAATLLGPLASLRVLAPSDSLAPPALGADGIFHPPRAR